MSHAETPPSPSLRILLVDDHRVVRDGLRLMLELQPGWKVCGEASSGREGVAQVLALRPDVVVMDVTLPELSGIEALRQIRKSRPQTEVIIFTAHEMEDLVQTVFDLGGRSYLLKTDDSTEVVHAVQAAAQRKPYFTPRISEIVYRRFTRTPGETERPEPGSALTARERETLRLVAEGRSNKEVAESMGVGLRTAESHRAALMKKLGLNSVGEVVRYAIRNRIIEA